MKNHSDCPAALVEGLLNITLRQFRVKKYFLKALNTSKLQYSYLHA